MKKFFIKDEDGKKFEVEEIEKVTDEDIDENLDVMDDDDITLTPDEIAALKKLAPLADKLVEMFADEQAEEEEVETSEEEISEEDAVEEEEEEEVIRTGDSKKVSAKNSFGSLERKNKTADSVETQQNNIEAAWAKRYGGRE